jgi:hypothetical protein
MARGARALRRAPWLLQRDELRLSPWRRRPPPLPPLPCSYASPPPPPRAPPPPSPLSARGAAPRTLDPPLATAGSGSGAAPRAMLPRPSQSQSSPRAAPWPTCCRACPPGATVLRGQETMRRSTQGRRSVAVSSPEPVGGEEGMKKRQR